MSVLVPVVIEKDPNGFERSYDIYSRLLKDFVVFVTGEINMNVANTFIAQLLFLENEDPKRDVSIYINSNGGDAYAAFAIIPPLLLMEIPKPSFSGRYLFLNLY